MFLVVYILNYFNLFAANCQLFNNFSDADSRHVPSDMKHASSRPLYVVSIEFAGDPATQQSRLVFFRFKLA